jgi:bifunctional non-homologous end joining protein LigD
VASKKVSKQELEVQGRTLTVTNLDKVFYPAAGFTKGQLIDYYIRVSEYMLPHLKDRPVTLKRYPDGVEGGFFYEKNAPRYTPEWVKTFPVPRRSGESNINYIMVNDLATLVWCANIATIEFHTFLHRVPAIDRPTEIVFDLDPGEGSSVLKCAEVAFILREVLDELKLKSFPKVSGSKGIQIYVPLNTAATYDATGAFARTLAQLLERRHPKLIISEMAKDVRKNKVFIDWSQNADFKTTAAVYSMRAKSQHPFISAPVSWEELEKALADKESAGLYFQPEAALERLKRVGDLFAPLLKLKQRLPKDFVERLKSGKSR